MKWKEKGFFDTKMVSEDGLWEIYDGEFGHAALRLRGTRKGFLLKSQSATSHKAIEEAEARIRDYQKENS